MRKRIPRGRSRTRWMPAHSGRSRSHSCCTQMLRRPSTFQRSKELPQRAPSRRTRSPVGNRRTMRMQLKPGTWPWGSCRRLSISRSLRTARQRRRCNSTRHCCCCTGLRGKPSKLCCQYQQRSSQPGRRRSFPALCLMNTSHLSNQCNHLPRTTSRSRLHRWCKPFRPSSQGTSPPNRMCSRLPRLQRTCQRRTTTGSCLKPSRRRTTQHCISSTPRRRLTRRSQRHIRWGRLLPAHRRNPGTKTYKHTDRKLEKVAVYTRLSKPLTSGHVMHTLWPVDPW